MQGDPTDIVRCPSQRVSEAISLVLSDLAPSQRREIAGPLLELEDPTDLGNEPLYVSMRDNQVWAAAWGQRQSGNIAVFWPPRFVDGLDEKVAHQLAGAVVSALDQSRIEMTQVLLESFDIRVVTLLRLVGFRHLADLIYMTCEAERFPKLLQTPSELDFVSYQGAFRGRLAALVERTYEGTLDCISLNGIRTIDDVINGYQATGAFRHENWMLVRAANQDVGVLLLADHPKARHWELMYMGLAPEFRGRGWGGQITRHAQWLAGRAGVERIVVAVDAANLPAVAMYRKAGFEIWDRRTVYARFPAKRDAETSP
jgi:ribosomal protein S18 acetylase RimI-like enzyme